MRETARRYNMRVEFGFFQEADLPSDAVRLEARVTEARLGPFLEASINRALRDAGLGGGAVTVCVLPLLSESRISADARVASVGAPKVFTVLLLAPDYLRDWMGSCAADWIKRIYIEGGDVEGIEARAVILASAEVAANGGGTVRPEDWEVVALFLGKLHDLHQP
jgi:hypothetical protein